MFLRPRTEERLRWYATEEAPNEVVGLLDANQKIFLLKNLSESPYNSFSVAKEAILHVVNRPDFVGPLDQVTLWHSHPSGQVGPSSEDMKHRTLFNNHLVVTLQGGKAVFTWY